MGLKPSSAIALGKFFDYPADATGSVTPYWLASSPGSGHRVRMTGACKRAFLATIEAVIERAIVPASSGTTPGSGTNFKTTDLDQLGLVPLAPLGPLDGATYRAALGAKLARGCPKEDWDNLVECVKSLWTTSGTHTHAGFVLAWQVQPLDEETSGFVDMQGWSLYEVTTDLSFYVADNEAAAGNPIALRIWGDYAGGSGGAPATEWLITSLNYLGVRVDLPSFTPGGFADDTLNGTPKPIAEGHNGNWFGSSAGEMVGRAISARRSSSAWAVLQAMLANMKYSHLIFSYQHDFSVYRTTRTITRYVTMDEDTGDICTVEEGVVDNTEYDSDSPDISVSSSCSFTDGMGTREVKFKCLEGGEANLVVSVRPATGWRKIGSGILPYLTFGSVTNMACGNLELSVTTPVSVSNVFAGSMSDTYPAASMRQYVEEFCQATFVDRETFSGRSESWTKWSVRQEQGNYDLKLPVAAHAAWLLSQVPRFEFPAVGSNPGRLGRETSEFWNNWEVGYPDTPNIQIGGNGAYFPNAFRNNTFTTHTEIPITHGNGAWESGTGYECVFGFGRMAFPDLDEILEFDGQTFSITPRGEALAGYKWAFKAMMA